MCVCVLGALLKFWQGTWSKDCEGLGYTGGMPGTVGVSLSRSSHILVCCVCQINGIQWDLVNPDAENPNESPSRHNFMRTESTNVDTHHCVHVSSIWKTC